MTTGRGLRVGEAALGGAVLALGLFVAVETALIRVAPSQATIGPRLFPFLIAAGLLVVGALLLREAIVGGVAHERLGLELDWRAVALGAAGLAGQLLLVEWIGWIPAAALLFTAVAFAFASRRPGRDLLIGLALGALTFLLFSCGLDLGLPLGSALEALLEGSDGDGGDGAS
jgi:putative tricarboxylic transport membrane protein